MTIERPDPTRAVQEDSPESAPAGVTASRRDIRQLFGALLGITVGGVAAIVIAAVFFIRQEATDRRLEAEAEKRCQGFIRGYELLGEEMGAPQARIDAFLDMLYAETDCEPPEQSSR